MLELFQGCLVGAVPGLFSSGQEGLRKKLCFGNCGKDIKINNIYVLITKIASTENCSENVGLPIFFFFSIFNSIQAEEIIFSYIQFGYLSIFI